MNLTGGQHGFLPLVLMHEQWRNIPNTVDFNKPQNPGAFTPSPGHLTNAETAVAKACWETKL